MAAVACHAGKLGDDDSTVRSAASRHLRELLDAGKDCECARAAAAQLRSIFDAEAAKDKPDAEVIARLRYLLGRRAQGYSSCVEAELEGNCDDLARENHVILSQPHMGEGDCTAQEAIDDYVDNFDGWLFDFYSMVAESFPDGSPVSFSPQFYPLDRDDGAFGGDPMPTPVVCYDSETESFRTHQICMNVKDRRPLMGRFRDGCTALGGIFYAWDGTPEGLDEDRYEINSTLEEQVLILENGELFDVYYLCLFEIPPSE